MKHKAAAVFVVVAFIAGALVTYLVFARQIGVTRHQRAIAELSNTSADVESRLRQQSAALTRQLSAFSRSVAADREFSMLLLVENNRVASAVTELAGSYRGPMGFDLLDIIDSGGVLVSCGSEPAHTGMTVQDRIALLGTTAQVIMDTTGPLPGFSWQARCNFTIADIPFSCTGGYRIDDSFLRNLTSRPGIRLILRSGDRVTGMPDVRTISDIVNNTIIINNTTYLAAPVALAGIGTTPVSLFAVMDMPAGMQTKQP